MTEAVVRGEVDSGYALVNPPGHHALPDTGMGFCLFNNVASRCKHAQAALGVGRVAVVDWDVHHGNGTQAVFADDPVGADALGAPGPLLPAGQPGT